MTDQPVSDKPGTATLTRLDDGTVIVTHADPIILVSKKLLSRPDVTTYEDGVLTLDTAGKYRYRRIRSHDEHADVFHRITPDEEETG